MCVRRSWLLFQSKLSGAKFRPRSSKESVQNVFICAFHCKPRQSGVSLESPGMENIPQVPGNRAKVGQTHDARKVVLASLLVLKLSGAIFRPRSSIPSVRSFYLSPFHWKLGPSGVNLESPGLENKPQVTGNRGEVGQTHDARKAVSATLSVSKWSGATFHPRSSKLYVQKVLLCSFHCKPRPLRVSLESTELKNILQAPWNRAEVGQNHDARKTVSATLLVFKWSGAIFRPGSSKVSVPKVWPCPFHFKRRPSRVSLESPGLEYIPQVPGNRAKVGQNHDSRKAVLAALSVLKWSAAIFRPRSSKVSVEKILVCPFHCEPRQAEVSLQSQGLENIP